MNEPGSEVNFEVEKTGGRLSFSWIALFGALAAVLMISTTIAWGYLDQRNAKIFVSIENYDKDQKTIGEKLEEIRQEQKEQRTDIKELLRRR